MIPDPRWLSRGLPFQVLLLVTWALASPHPARGRLVINEVLAAPGQDWNGDGTVCSRGDAWIEIKNLGCEVEDLSGFLLGTGDRAVPDLRLQGLVPPGGVRVFHGSGAMIWQASQGFPPSGFELGSAAAVVRLLQEVRGPDGVRWLETGRVQLLEHETRPDRSSGWAEEGGGWVLFDAWNPYRGSSAPGPTACRPTPGKPNYCLPLGPDRGLAWDVVKSYFSDR
jgi:hypothetical protein